MDRLVPAGPLTVVVDDTLFHRAGTKVWAAGWFHDGSAKGDRQVGFGNNWVIVGLAVPVPLLGRPVCLPVLKQWRAPATRCPRRTHYFSNEPTPAAIFIWLKDLRESV
ncbi:hypothetical protein FAIPA1_380029 [Frankia sp. AiPs1]|uniref:hypothetical protein n=1 Tax=Frankia sp. AiPa1 TaxID=573492 RepID=UPI00202B93FD|nr:hypothetical protein [Frankia sp. AiPa1]MCL9762973.1 hypothetical protein [Frankia sp. AiPa1]